jgi:hypothetical protein
MPDPGEPAAMVSGDHPFGRVPQVPIDAIKS